jgi:hypothetical protein
MIRSPRRAKSQLVVTAVALAIVILAAIIDRRVAAAAFIVAYAATLSVALGAMAMIMIANLTRATWFGAFRAAAEAMVASLAILAPLSVPMLASLAVLYQPALASGQARTYMAPAFVVFRTIVYWIVWLALARALRRSHRVSDGGDSAVRRNVRTVSSVGLIALGLTMSFAAIDWLMALTPSWYSTIYGVYWFAGGMIGGLAVLALLTAMRFESDGPAVASTHDIASLGKLLLTFVLFWLYIGFSQYIVIWSGGVPRETTWYVSRSRDGWGLVAGVLIFGNFVLPFLLLLPEFVRRSRTALALISALLLVMHCLDTFWLVVPDVVPVDWWMVLVSVAMLIVVIEVAAAFAWRAGRANAPVPRAASLAAG